MNKKIIAIITFPDEFEDQKEGVDVQVHHIGTNELDLLETFAPLLKDTAQKCAEEIGVPLDEIASKLNLKFL